MTAQILHPGQELDLQRGDLIHVDLTGATGTEKQGTRPALVVETTRDIGYANSVIVAPLTSQRDPDALGPTEVEIPSTETTGLPQDSVVQLSQLRTISTGDRIQEVYGWLEADQMEAVNAALRYALELDEA